MTDEQLLSVLKNRFEANPKRHPGIEWARVLTRLQAVGDKLLSLKKMEETGGEPDVVVFEGSSDEILFVDCAAETPAGRRNVCYDRPGQELRNKKGVFPEGNALDIAADMGAQLLTEAQYRALQALGEFDTKTSSWLQTPPEVRALGGALFGDRRYNRVFVYHNSAPSFYGVRGFRVLLRV